MYVNFHTTRRVNKSERPALGKSLIKEKEETTAAMLIYILHHFAAGNYCLMFR